MWWLAFFSGFTAHAFPIGPLAPAPSDIHQASFRAATEIEKSAGILAAMPRIVIQDEAGNVLDICSSNLVSKDGTLLTDGHCIDKCLQKAGAIHDVGGIPVVDQSQLSKTECYIRIGNKVSQAQILATNDCHGGRKKFLPGSGDVHCKGLDFAVLKLDSSVTGGSCVQVSNQLPGPDRAVVGAGYSALTWRYFNKKSGVLDPYQESSYNSISLSEGTTIPIQNYCTIDPTGLKDPSQGGKREFEPLFSDFLAREGQSGDIIQTSGAEFIQGGSGGGLLDRSSGELLGLAGEINWNSREYECKGGTFYTSTAGILKFMKEKYPELNQSQLFNCKKGTNAVGSPVTVPAAPSGNSDGPARSVH
jgi:hypothetical protein